VLAALERLDPARLGAFASEVARAPGSAERTLAAVRILGARRARRRRPGLLGLASYAEEHGEFDALEGPLADALDALLARAPEGLARLRERWGSLAAGTASAALARRRPHARARGLRRRARAARSALRARRRRAAGARQPGRSRPARERQALADELVPYLGSPRRELALAAASALARIGKPETIPALIEAW
jgi:hypothetical protein